MELVCHGGSCCGIKTIKGFGCYRPNSKMGYLGKDSVEEPLTKTDIIYHDHAYPGKRFFHEAAPKETSLERLDRYLVYLDKMRPNCICEAALADYGPHAHYQHYQHWAPLLLERGFVEVSSCYNSNSGNRVHILHRVMDKAVPSIA